MLKVACPGNMNVDKMNKVNLQNKYPQWMRAPNQEGILSDKKAPNVQRSILEDGLPFLEFRGSIIYSYEASDCSLLSEDIRQTLSDGAAVGFDIEWPPSYTKGKMAKIAVIQICVTEEKCYLFHISSMSGTVLPLFLLLRALSFLNFRLVRLIRNLETGLELWGQYHTHIWRIFAVFFSVKKFNLSSDDRRLLTAVKQTTLESSFLFVAGMYVTTVFTVLVQLLVLPPRAAEILADISENVKALGSTLFAGSSSPSVLERSCGATPTKLEAKSTNVEPQQAEMPEFAKNLEGDFNICSDATLAGLWEGEVDEGEAGGGNAVVEDGATAAGSKDTADRDDFMSLDFNEQELQILERQAAKEVLNKAVPEEECPADNEQNTSCIIESDEELEMEMLKSLEDVDNSKEVLAERESSKGRKTPDAELNVAPDGDEDEVVEEEEEECWDPSLSVPSEIHIACLKMYFGHSSFKPVQWKVIRSVLEDKRDNLVVMATGYGKSLCYQFPPVYTGGTGIVVYVCPCTHLHLLTVMVSFCLGLYRVIYMTPEFCSGNLELLQDIDQTTGIALIAVDEAHCISEWGHDFRNSFRKLNSLKKALPSVPIVALTATASPSIREDIVNCLNLKNPQITCTSFDRPNLYLEVGRQSGNILRDLKQFLTRKGNSSTYEFEGPTIIYCPSRKATEQVVSELNKLGVTCGAYHAGMGIQKRRETHHQFMRDEIQCVVATVAFGMGINKADIRMVIHYGAPKEMESYYQEIGRAGRDGLPASCHVLWAAADLVLNRRLLNEIYNEKFRLYKLKMLEKMEKYLSSNSCRRKIILSHFEDKQLRKVSSGIMGTEECCDNCRCRTSCLATSSDSEGGLQDFGKQAYQLLSAVCALEEKFGTRVPILFLRGSNSQRLPDRYRKHALYGSGKDWTENWWKSLSQQLIMEGFLREVSGRSKFATTCGLTQKGRNWLLKAESASNPSLLLQSNEDLNLQRTPRSSRPSPAVSMQRSPDTKGTKQSPVKQMSLYEMFAYDRKSGTLPRSNTMVNSPPERSPVKSPLRPRVPVVSSRENELETALYGKLLTARQKVANEKVIPPAVLATNKILVEMARMRPTTVENVKRIDGVSEAKSTMLVLLLAEIKDFCQANSLQTDIFPKPESTDQKEASPWKNTKALSPSEHVTYVLFQEKNLSLRTISETRSLPLTEVGTHLFQAVKAGYPVNLERAGLTPEVQQIISDIIRNPPIDSDTTKIQAIRKLVPANIELYLIQMAIALLEKKDGSKSKYGSGAKRMLVLSDGQQEKTGADQTSRGKALWSRRKDNLTNPTLKEGDEIKRPQVVPSALAAWSTDDAQPDNRGTADRSEPIQLASRNQPALSPEEELFADTQPKSSQPPGKRKVPPWFGASAAPVLPVPQTKKPKADTRRGIFN
uniref:DNA 3'-5' helicase n=1 Tax=Pavo cristatus TaxID=9049 RepID=A0A8C9EK05_PAVCR